MFINGVVNDAKFAIIWRPGDTIRVCDRSICVQLEYSGSPTGLWVFNYARPDPGGDTLTATDIAFLLRLVAIGGRDLEIMGMASTAELVVQVGLLGAISGWEVRG